MEKASRYTNCTAISSLICFGIEKDISVFKSSLYYIDVGDPKPEKVWRTVRMVCWVFHALVVLWFLFFKNV